MCFSRSGDLTDTAAASAAPAASMAARWGDREWFARKRAALGGGTAGSGDGQLEAGEVETGDHQWIEHMFARLATEGPHVAGSAQETEVHAKSAVCTSSAEVARDKLEAVLRRSKGDQAVVDRAADDLRRCEALQRSLVFPSSKRDRLCRQAGRDHARDSTWIETVRGR